MCPRNRVTEIKETQAHDRQEQVQCLCAVLQPDPRRLTDNMLSRLGLSSKCAFFWMELPSYLVPSGGKHKASLEQCLPAVDHPIFATLDNLLCAGPCYQNVLKKEHKHFNLFIFVWFQH